MATSPTHRFGQIIGDLLKIATVEKVRPVVSKHGMYLDSIHPRPARGNRRKIHVEDALGNYHDLDLVVEEGGSEEVLGKPRAFIEVAWRRYTKHSKNKAQEISSAVLACAKRFADDAPFMGTVLAGDFTQNSLDQLTSQGFVVVHFPLDAIVDAFAVAGIDAYWEEDTPDAQVKEQVRRYDALSKESINAVKERLFDLQADAFDTFTHVLDASLDRRVKEVRVLTLWGISQAFTDLAGARAYIESVNERSAGEAGFLRYEVEIEYTNGSKTRMTFADKYEALRKLALMED